MKSTDYKLYLKVNSIMESQSLILLMLNDLTNCKYKEDVQNSIKRMQECFKKD